MIIIDNILRLFGAALVAFAIVWVTDSVIRLVRYVKVVKAERGDYRIVEYFLDSLED